MFDYQSFKPATEYDYQAKYVSLIDAVQADMNTVTNFPAGTTMLFQQTTPPTGWTKDTTHNDKSLRVVSGSVSSGGASAFSSVFGSGKATGAHALSVSEMPSHDHSGNTGNQSANHTHNQNITTGNQNASHTHSYNKTANSALFTSGATNALKNTTNANTGNQNTSHTHNDNFTSANQSVNHTHALSAEGGAAGHAHTESLDLHYVDVIIATKD